MSSHRVAVFTQGGDMTLRRAYTAFGLLFLAAEVTLNTGWALALMTGLTIVALVAFRRVLR